MGRSPQSSARCANGGKVTHVPSDLWARCCSPYSAFRSCSPTRERAHHLEVYATCWQAVRTRFIRRRPALETCDSSPESGWLPALATPMAAPSAGSAAQAALSITDPARMGSRELTHGSPWLRADFPLLSRVSLAAPGSVCQVLGAQLELRSQSPIQLEWAAESSRTGVHTLQPVLIFHFYHASPELAARNAGYGLRNAGCVDAPKDRESRTTDYGLRNAGCVDSPKEDTVGASHSHLGLQLRV